MSLQGLLTPGLLRQPGGFEGFAVWLTTRSPDDAETFVHIRVEALAADSPRK
jgi:hypothetical protein